MKKAETIKTLENVSNKYFSMREALEYLASRDIKKSLGWLRIEILKQNIKTFKSYTSRVVLKEDIHKLAESLK